MNWRNRLSILMVTSLFAVGSVMLAGSVVDAKKPPAKIVIKGCKKKKPPVHFNHAAHIKKLKKKCETCHHKIKGKKNKKRLCTKCHMEKKGKIGTCQDKSKKKNPFHIRCIGCHKKSGKKDAPTKCKQCHKK